MKKGLKITLLSLLGLGILSSTVFVVEQATNHGLSDSIKEIFNKNENEEYTTLTIDDFGGVSAFSNNINDGQFLGSNQYFKLENDKKYKIDTSSFSTKFLFGFTNPASSLDPNCYSVPKFTNYFPSDNFYYTNSLTFQSDLSTTDTSLFSFKYNPSYYDYYISVKDGFIEFNEIRKFDCDFINGGLVINEKLLDSPFVTKYTLEDNSIIYSINNYYNYKFYFAKSCIKDNYYFDYSLYTSGEPGGTLAGSCLDLTLSDESTIRRFKLDVSNLNSNYIYETYNSYQLSFRQSNALRTFKYFD